MFKYLLYFLNIVFVVSFMNNEDIWNQWWHRAFHLQLGGILLIVVGSLILSAMGNFYSAFTSFSPQTIPICIIVIGCVVFVVAFFGCCGTIRENACCTSIVSSPFGIFSACMMELILFHPSFSTVRHLHVHSVRAAIDAVHLDLCPERQVPFDDGRLGGHGI